VGALISIGGHRLLSLYRIQILTELGRQGNSVAVDMGT
jgi:hypothetical protein